MPKREYSTSRLGRADDAARREAKKIAFQIAKDGKVTPLEIMVIAMRYHYDEFVKLSKDDKIIEATIEKSKKRPDEENFFEVKGGGSRNLKEYHLDRAVSYAGHAAPYIHQKLQTTTLANDPENPVTTPNIRITFVDVPEDPA